MSKKKFNLEKYLEWFIKNYGVKALCKDLKNPNWLWYLECDGLTEQEMLEKGYVIGESWMEEVQ